MYCSFDEEIVGTDDQGREEYQYRKRHGKILEYLVVKNEVHAVVRCGDHLKSIPLPQLSVGDGADCV